MKLEKLLDKIAVSVLEEIFELGPSNTGALHKVVSDSEANIARAVKERDAMPEYQKAKQDCKDLSEGLREVRTFQKAKAAVALAILGEDELTDDESEALDRARRRVTEDQRKRKAAA